MTRNFALILLCALATADFQCSTPISAGNGGSSETVNAKVVFQDTTITVIATDPEVTSLTLQVFSPNFRPFENYGYNDSVSVYASNTLSWNAPGEGDFCCLIKSPPGKSSCFLGNITLTHSKQDTVECVLGPCCDITGSIEPEDGVIVDSAFSLSIYGSPFFCITGARKNFIMKDIPSGSFTLSVRSTTPRLFEGTENYQITTDTHDRTLHVRVLIR